MVELAGKSSTISSVEMAEDKQQVMSNLCKCYTLLQQAQPKQMHGQ